ncbi:hypothetical protein PILCRDRAFT_80479 [Piloderma croceum F 1598]|uniref:Uncharacterized protein n=1 Tax=Piloderma croceum (strain F 1598) TaxID=765440 RepID=A0A0C3F233_PILCF|nr:hypothetical protein PILCRDRAFT_80479 [Piloderma croceum F 1598]
MAELAYRKAKGKAREGLKAQQRKAAAPYGDFAVKPGLVNKHIRNAGRAISTSLDASDMPHASTSYVGTRYSGGPRRIFGLDELVGKDSPYGFEIRKWDGCTPTPILDTKQRVIGICAGRPDDASWGKTEGDAAAAMGDAREKCHFSKGAESHRRGLFPALAIGASFGGGQQVPGNLINGAINSAILCSLLSNVAFVRIAGFASGVFATWAPHLYSYYVDHLGPLFKHYPDLRRNFVNSVFACATFNFGPHTCCFDHVDFGNLPFGWCAITALGNFNPIFGGHLVLWDLKIVIEFPPGSTILIPSGAIRHSNIAIRRGETRYSFTQYTAGGLFRWVDHGYQTETSYRRGWKKDRKFAEDLANQQRWIRGVGMFSTLAELETISRQ